MSVIACAAVALLGLVWLVRTGRASADRAEPRRARIGRLVGPASIAGAGLLGVCWFAWWCPRETLLVKSNAPDGSAVVRLWTIRLPSGIEGEYRYRLDCTGEAIHREQIANSTIQLGRSPARPWIAPTMGRGDNRTTAAGAASSEFYLGYLGGWDDLRHRAPSSIAWTEATVEVRSHDGVVARFRRGLR